MGFNVHGYWCVQSSLGCALPCDTDTIHNKGHAFRCWLCGPASFCLQTTVFSPLKVNCQRTQVMFMLLQQYVFTVPYISPPARTFLFLYFGNFLLLRGGTYLPNCHTISGQLRFGVTGNTKYRLVEQGEFFPTYGLKTCREFCFKFLCNHGVINQHFTALKSHLLICFLSSLRLQDLASFSKYYFS